MPSDSTQLPAALVAALARGEVAIVTGGDLSRQFLLPNSPPPLQDFVEGLATTCEFPHGVRRRLFDVLEWDTGRVNRNAVTQRIIAEYGARRQSIPGLQSLFARRPPLVVHVGYDESVFESLTAAQGQPPNTVVRDSDVRYISDDGRTTLIFLLGRATDPDSLITTTVEYHARFDRQHLIHRFLSGHIAVSTILFVGFSGNDDSFDFEDFYQRLIGVPTDRHSRRNFWVCDRGPDAALRSRLQDRDLDVIEVPRVTDFVLRACAAAMLEPSPQRRDRSAAARTSTTPYFYLQPYSDSDEGLFFGRTRATEALVSLVHGHSMCLIFGASGVGKTSLLRAGVGPDLRRRGFSFYWTRLLPSPRAAVANMLGRPQPDASGGTWFDLVETFLRDRPDANVVIAFDQMEEFFADVPEPARRAFWKDAARCRDSGRVRLIFGIRADALFHMNEAFPEIVQPFSGMFQVCGFTPDEREEAIREPALLWGRPWSGELTAILSSEIADTDGQTAQLSIVLTVLWERRSEFGDDVAAYRALRGVRGILEDYLWGTIDRHSDRELLLRTLEAFVSPERRRIQLTTLDVAADLGEYDEAGREHAAALCETLVSVRLLRPVEHHADAFELAHDILAASLAARLSEHDMRAKLARRALRDAQHEFRGSGHLPSRSAYKAFAESLNRPRLTTDDLMFLTVLAAAAGEPIDELLIELERRGVHRAAAISALLESRDVWSIHEALTRIAAEPTEDLRRLLPKVVVDTRPSVQLHTLDVLGVLGVIGTAQEFGVPIREVLIPAGDFVFGYPVAGDVVRPALSNQPQVLYLDDYFIDRFPVTQAEYARFLADTNHLPPPSWRNGKPSSNRLYHPICDVTWEDACAYARWQGKRLPTEAEWEKAAYWDYMNSTKRPFPWGETFSPDRANVVEAGYGTTSPVGLFSPGGDSSYGVSDMGGNLFEWCLDDALYPAPPFKHARNPYRHLGASNTFKVSRGGSYGGPHEQIHCAWRGYNRAPVAADVYIGFRCVRSVHHPVAEPV